MILLNWCRNDVKKMKVAPSRPFMGRNGAQHWSKVVLISGLQSHLHSCCKWLYPGAEPFCPPVPYGTYRGCLSNFAWLWAIERAPEGESKAVSAF